MRGISAIFALGMIAALSGGMVSPARADDNNLAQLLSNQPTVSDDLLAQQRGGTAQQIGNVEDNLVLGGKTGDNHFGSFGSSQGMISAFQNTGNNVVMQSQMTVNVELH
jgi:hypothetical protein